VTNPNVLIATGENTAESLVRNLSKPVLIATRENTAARELMNVSRVKKANIAAWVLQHLSKPVLIATRGNSAETLQNSLAMPVKIATRENTAAWELLNVRVVMLAPITRTQGPLFAQNVNLVLIIQQLEQLYAHNARLALPHFKKSLLPILALHVRQVLIRRQMEQVNVLLILYVLLERIQMMGDQLLKIHVLIVLRERILQKLEQLNAHNARLEHIRRQLEQKSVRIVQPGPIRQSQVLHLVRSVWTVMLAPTTRTQEPLFA
jgi:hypothetical protein